MSTARVLFAGALLVLACRSDLAGQSSPHPFSSTTFSPPEAPAEEYSKLAFELAHTSALVEVEGIVGGQLRLRVLEVFRGYRTRQPLELEGFGRANPRYYPQGSRWLVATGDPTFERPRLIEMLPDSPANRSAVSDWTVPGWLRTPVVLVVKLAERTRNRLSFDVIRTLRGEYAGRELADRFIPYESVQSYEPGEQLYVLSAFVQGDQGASIRSLDPVDEAELPVIERALEADPFGRLRHALRRETEDMAVLEQAWRFRGAALVAEVEVSHVRNEISGAGGMHLTLAPVRVLRGSVPDLLPETQPMRGLWMPPPGQGLFYAGGHAYYGEEVVGSRFLAAGDEVGGPALLRVPATEQNRRLVEFFLKQAPPPWQLLEGTWPPPEISPPAEVASEGDLFDRSRCARPSLAAGDGPGFVSFERRGRRRAERSSCWVMNRSTALRASRRSPHDPWKRELRARGR